MWSARQATALIVSGDEKFAETMKARLQSWGLMVSLSEDSPSRLPFEVEAAIVLLDIRQVGSEALIFLRNIKEKMPAAEVILINRADNIPLSIAGMQAGATDELIAPFDTSTLQNTISAALRRRKKQQGKKSLLQRFEEAMAAATFAQAGEFDTAIAMLNDETDKQNPSASKKQ